MKVIDEGETGDLFILRPDNPQGQFNTIHTKHISSIFLKINFQAI